jgi:hypothetical protein
LYHFIFFAGTPFDGAVQNKHKEKEFVFISIKRLFAQKNDFKILIQHPLSIPDFDPIAYDEGIEMIDWSTMELRNYQDHKCAEICMAECLSPKVIKPTDFFSIYTPNDNVKKKVVALRNKIVGNIFHVDVNDAIFVK